MPNLNSRTAHRLSCALTLLRLPPAEHADILSRSIEHDTTINRYLCAWLISADGPGGSGVGLQQISLAFNRRNHSTFVYAFKRLVPWPGPPHSSINTLAKTYETLCLDPESLDAARLLAPQPQSTRADLMRELRLPSAGAAA